MALTQQAAFEALKACLISAPILRFPQMTDDSFWTRMPVFMWWGCSKPDSRRSGSGYRLCQSKPSPFSRTVLYDASRNAGGGCYVHTFSVVPSGCSVHPTHRSQLSPVAAEGPLWDMMTSVTVGIGWQWIF